jgi:uncharacterized membrane protein
METQLWAIILVLITGIIGAFGPIYLKKGTNIIKFNEFSTIYQNKFLIIGVLIYGLCTVLFIPALKGGDLSILYPLVGLEYVWICIYSIYMLNEKMNFWKWMGIASIVLGVTFIGLGA